MAGTRDFAAWLARARVAAGLSPGALAARAGISRVSVREAELGRDPRRSSVVALVRALPGAGPHDVLAGTEGRVPSPDTGPWSLLRDLHGGVARLLRRTLTIEGDACTIVDEVLDLRCEDAGAVVRLAWIGSAAGAVRFEDAMRKGRGRAAIDDGDVRHELVARGRGAFDYRRTARRAASPGAAATPEECLAFGSCVVVDAPARALEIVVRGASPTQRGRLIAWPSPLVPEANEPDLTTCWRLPESSLEWGAGILRARIERPHVGLTYALAPGASKRSAPASRSVIAAARARAGLSLRALAAVTGAGAMTLADVEAGCDARLSTLTALSGALASLSSWDLLGLHCDDAGEAKRRAWAWAWQRDLFGCEIDLEWKHVEIDATGDARMVIRTRSLRRVRPGAVGDLRVRVGFTLPVVHASKASLRGVVAQAVRGLPDVRIAPVAGLDGSASQQLLVPESVAARGVSYSRTLEHRSVYAMTAERAAARVAGDGPFIEGASFAPFLPTRTLRLSVRFPPGFEPLDARAGAWAMRSFPSPTDDRAVSVAHPDGLPLRAHRSRRLLTLEIPMPLLGAKYGVSWRLPE